MKRIGSVIALLALTLACGGLGEEDEPACPTLAEAGGLRLAYAVAEGGDPAAVAAAMQRRLEAVGPRCAAARVDGDLVVVEIAGSADREGITALGRTGRLSIRPRLPKPQAVGALVAMRPPAPIEVEGEGVARLVGPDAVSELQAWVDASQLPEGVVALVEPLPAEGAARVHLVRDDEGLLDATVVAAEEQAAGDGGSTVSVTLAPRDQRTLAALSTQHVHEALVIAVDDDVLGAPVIAQPLPSERPFALSPAPGQDAAALARTLRAGSLPAAVVPTSREVVEPASATP